MLNKIGFFSGDSQLLSNMVTVIIDGPDRTVQHISDLFRGQAFFDQMADLFLPG
jgi:hypothetical protein